MCHAVEAHRFPSHRPCKGREFIPRGLTSLSFREEGCAGVSVMLRLGPGAITPSRIRCLLVHFVVCQYGRRWRSNQTEQVRSLGVQRPPTSSCRRVIVIFVADERSLIGDLSYACGQDGGQLTGPLAEGDRGDRANLLDDALRRRAEVVRSRRLADPPHR